MKEVIDLYSKFLIAFIGIVTPALALYLNNYLIDRTKFEEVLEKEEKASKKLIDDQFKKAKDSPETNGMDLYDKSNNLLKERNEKLKSWKDVVDKLNPKKFFRKNLLLLSGALFFLFALLLLRSDKFIEYHPELSSGFQRSQMVACFLTVGLCGWHILNLINLGFYLIRVRPIVDEINEGIRLEKIKKGNTPEQVT